MATVPSLMIVNADVVAEHAGDDDAQSWLGQNVPVGAYFQSWDRGAQMTVVRDPNYYGGFNEHPTTKCADHHQRRGDGARHTPRRADHDPLIPVARHLRGAGGHGPFRVESRPTTTAST